MKVGYDPMSWQASGFQRLTLLFNVTLCFLVISTAGTSQQRTFAVWFTLCDQALHYRLKWISIILSHIMSGCHKLYQVCAKSKIWRTLVVEWLNCQEGLSFSVSYKHLMHEITIIGN